MEREDRDRRRLEAMHAKRYPIDDLDLIAEQRYRSSYSSGSSSMLPGVLLSIISGYSRHAKHHILTISTRSQAATSKAATPQAPFICLLSLVMQPCIDGVLHRLKLLAALYPSFGLDPGAEWHCRGSHSLPLRFHIPHLLHAISTLPEVFHFASQLV